MRRRPPTGLLAVVAALVVLLVAGQLVGRGQVAHRSAQTVPVTGASLVCPDLRQATGLLTALGVGTPVAPDARGAVRGQQTGVSSALVPVPLRVAGRAVAGVGTTVTGDGVDVAASAGLAPGLAAEQLTTGTAGAPPAEHGLAGLRCTAPGTDAWFVGGATRSGDATTLVLVNDDESGAVVDVTPFSESGPVDARSGTGLLVGAHRRLVVRVDTLAPGHALLALHVVTRQGRVTAALRYGHADGQVSLGVDWVPQTAAPALTQVVPGVPQGTGRRLLLANPTEDDTVVRVQVTTTSGQYVPTALASVDVPAQSTASVPLDATSATSALGLTVTSDGVPVVAAVQVDERVGGRETAFTAAGPPLSGAAVSTGSDVAPGTLLLTAPLGAARAVVDVLPVGDVPGQQRTVAVPAGRTTLLDLTTLGVPGPVAVSVVPQPGSGPIYAARYVVARTPGGLLSTLLDLGGTATTARRPPAVQDDQASR